MILKEAFRYQNSLPELFIFTFYRDSWVFIS